MRLVMKPTPTLRTGALTLRPPGMADAPAIAAALSDYAVAGMLARVPQPYDRKEAEDWLARVLDAGNPDHVFAIDKDSGLIGVIGLEDRDGTAAVGYWLARPHWGRGIMSRALEAVLHWHFDAGGGPHQAGAFADNPASLRVQAKLGFRVTGSGHLFSVARNASAEHIETRLTLDDWKHVLAPAA